MTPCPKHAPSSAPSGVCQWFGEDALCLRPDEFACIEWRQTGLPPVRDRRAPQAPTIPSESSTLSQPDGMVRLVAWQVFSETEKALMVGHQRSFRSEAIWLPKSQIRSRIDLPNGDGPQFVTLTLTAWIAKEKHLS